MVRKTSRRQVVAAIGAGSTIGLAGCIGGIGGNLGGGSTTTIRMHTSTEGSSTYQVSQGMAAVVNKYSDSLQLDARPSDGAAQSMRFLDKGETDIAFTNRLDAYNILNGEGIYADAPFENPDQIRTVHRYHDLNIGLTVKGDSGIETVHDLKGKRVSPCPVGTSCRPAGYAAIGHAIDLAEVEQVSIGFADEASALQEGRVDAISDLRINKEQISATAQQQYAIIEGATVVHWPEEVREAIRNDDRLGGFVIPAEVTPGPDFGDRTEEFWPTINYHLYTTTNMDADVIHQLMSLLWEHMDELAEYHVNTTYWDDLEFWSGEFLAPAHEGAAQFFDEQGA